MFDASEPEVEDVPEYGRAGLKRYQRTSSSRAGMESCLSRLGDKTEARKHLSLLDLDAVPAKGLKEGWRLEEVVPERSGPWEGTFMFNRTE